MHLDMQRVFYDLYDGLFLHNGSKSLGSVKCFYVFESGLLRLQMLHIFDQKQQK